MLFNSSVFLLFIIVVFPLYWIIKNVNKQNLLLLIASYIFYGWWDWRFLSLIVLSSAIDYVVGIKTAEATLKKTRKNWLLVSLIANLGLLGVFKYYNFFAESFSELMQTFGWTPNELTLNIILPVGISFYTFQTLSYTIDIYRKKLKPTKNIISFFTYISFFPQLVAGPIERASNLLPQIEKKRDFSISLFNGGVVQIIVGLFRKIVIADTLGAYVDTIYAHPEYYNSNTLILATTFYAFQIYFDFSGYSDIAIGTAKTFGFKFKQNFNLPYFSRSLTEFWRKWHMSLSYWLRDYLYISLGGNRKGSLLTYRNLMITMLLGGLWHGSSWNFIIWGGIHGIVLSIEKFASSKSLFSGVEKIKPLGYFITFSIVLFAWIFFRAKDLETALIIVNRIFSYDFSMPFIGVATVLIHSLLALSIGLSFDIYLKYSQIDLEDLANTFSLKKIILFTSITTILICLFYSTSNNFIYFQF